MLKIHQPYIKTSKYRSRYTFALASIGVLLLACALILGFSPATHPVSRVYAAGDSRTLSDISTMQEMTQQICSNSDSLEPVTLQDTRQDGINSYKVIKLPDGNCWMQQNLRLNITASGLSKDDTDIASDWNSNSTVKPATTLVGSSTSVSGWYDNNGATYSATFNNSEYGNYYNWCAATAGTCSSSAENSGSICPKNWRLPTNSEYSTMLSKGSIGNSPIGSITISGSYYKFPYAGLVSRGSLSGVGTLGDYWSSTPNGSDGTYILAFNSSEVITSLNSRYRGFSVRCVAIGGLDKIEKPLFTEEAEGNVNVVVPSTLTIDATSGMAENADSSKITEGTATATVSSNTSYAITLHSTQPALKDPAVTTAEISPVSEVNLVQPGNNAWGFWNNKTNADGSKIHDTPITTEPQESYNTTVSSITDKGNTTTHTYYVGISIAPSLPSGTYSTNVTITAATK